MRSVILRSAIVGALFATGSCATVDGTPTAVSGQPEQSASVSRFPPVTFTPCDEIDDAMVRQLGFDPETRNAGGRTTEIELVTCSFRSYDRLVIFISQNRPWEELPSTLSGPHQPTTVNSRPSIYAVEPTGRGSCAILMRTDFGAVIVDMSLDSKPDSDPNLDACDGIMQVAETIEPLIETS